MALINRQRAFIEHYLANWNATAAALQAGYSPKTAYSQGGRLLKNVEIQSAISERLKELQATADEVKTRLTSHARGSMEDFISVTGECLDLERARDKGVLHLIKKFRVTTTTISKSDGEDIETHRVELELYDAQAATVQMGRALGVFVDKVEISDWRTPFIQLGIDPEMVREKVIDTQVKLLEAPATLPQPAALQPAETDDAQQLPPA